ILIEPRLHTVANGKLRHNETGAVLGKGGRETAHIGVMPATAPEADFNGRYLATNRKAGDDKAGLCLCVPRQCDETLLRAIVDHRTAIETAFREPRTLEIKSLRNKLSRARARRHNLKIQAAKGVELPHALRIALRLRPALREKCIEIAEMRRIEDRRFCLAANLLSAPLGPVSNGAVGPHTGQVKKPHIRPAAYFAKGSI